MPESRFLFAELPNVVAQVRQEQQTGCLRCVHEGTVYDLFFQSGRLIHATVSPSGLQGDAALYDLLGLHTGDLSWQAGATTTQATIDSAEVSDFFDALTALRERGVFAPTALPVPQPAAPTPVAPSRLAMLVPPCAFEETVGVDMALSVVFHALHDSQFSGYGLFERAGQQAMILFEVGQATAARLYNSDSLTGQEAAQAIVRDFETADLRLFRADPKTIAAFRALLGGHIAYTDLSATSATLTGLLGAFIRRQHTGVVVVHNTEHTGYYLIHSGTPCGLFAADPQGRLVLLGDRLAAETSARLDVYLTQMPETITFVASAPPPHRPTLATPFDDTATCIVEALVHLVGELCGRQRALDEFALVIEGHSPSIPALARLEQRHNTLPGGLAALDPATFSTLINLYLEPYNRSLGPRTFALMVQRSLTAYLPYITQNGLTINALASAALPQTYTPVKAANAFDF